MCARNAANRNNAKEKGTAINHHSGTIPYSYRVAANQAKGHPAPILQTVCDVYQASQNAQEKVAAVKRKMDELCASRVSGEASGSQVTGPVSVEEQMAVVEQELGGKPGTRVRGLGDALRRPPKPRGGARVSRDSSEVEELKRQLQVQAEENRRDKEEWKQRVATLEALLGQVITAQGNAGINLPEPTATVPDKSSCASKGNLEFDRVD